MGNQLPKPERNKCGCVSLRVPGIPPGEQLPSPLQQNRYSVSGWGRAGEAPSHGRYHTPTALRVSSAYPVQGVCVERVVGVLPVGLSRGLKTDLPNCENVTFFLSLLSDLTQEARRTVSSNYWAPHPTGKAPTSTGAVPLPPQHVPVKLSTDMCENTEIPAGVMDQLVLPAAT